MIFPLTEQKLQTMTGEFINRATGTIWKVYIKDAGLMLEVPHFSFLIIPVVGNRFKPANSQVKMEIEFETTDQNCFMHVYAHGNERATFEALI